MHVYYLLYTSIFYFNYFNQDAKKSNFENELISVGKFYLTQSIRATTYYRYKYRDSERFDAYHS